MTWPLVTVALFVAVGVLAVFTIVRTDPPERSVPVAISTSEWLPYISPELPDNGPIAVMLNEVLGRAGYTPEFTFTTWPLAERDVRNGATIGMAPVIISAERDEFALYTEPLLEFRYTLFGKKGALLESIPQRTELEGVRVARIAGYQYWDELDESGATFVDHPSSLSAFEALQNGEVELVAEGSIAGNAVLRSAEFGDDATSYGEADPETSLSSSAQGLHLLLRDTPEGRRLQQEFDAALTDFRTTEDYQRTLSSLTDSDDLVTLSSNEGGAIELFDTDHRSAGVTPSGTSAVVHAWPKGQLERGSMVSVKLLSGPYTGRVLGVRLEDVEMADA